MRLRSPMRCVPVTPRVLAAAAHTDASVDPIDIPKLAKMAQVRVSEQEVGATCMLRWHAQPGAAAAAVAWSAVQHELSTLQLFEVA
jgi:hypothetical protein